MLALPIARRELLVLSRAGATWKNRIGISAVVFGAGIVLSLMYHYGGQMALNTAMHFIGSGLSMMCLFAGVSLTADSIAEEKRGGTLGLLFLTHLSPFEIVMGKLIANGVAGFYALLCALPLLSMSMIFGGMRFSEVLMYMISALNALFFSSAIGLFASSICKDKRRSGSLGTLIVLLFWMVLPFIAMLLGTTGAPQWLIELITQVSINVFTPFNVGFSRVLPAGSRWWSLVWTQILAWAFIWLTVWMLPRRWQDEPPKKRWLLREAWRAISLGTPATRLKLRRKLLDRNAFMWLASRDRLQALGIWIGSVAVMGFFGFHFYRGRLPPDILILMATCLAIMQQVAFSGAAGIQLVREYEQGTLEMVLSTPFSVDDMIRGQLAAALRHYRSIFALTFLLLWAGLLLLLWRHGAARLLGVVTLVIFSGLFLLQFYTLAWVAMWSVTTAPDPKRANANAFFLITILPAMTFGLIVASAQLLTWLSGVLFSPGPELLLPLALVLGFGSSIYWLRRAKRELPQALRVFAFRRYTPVERRTLFGEIGRLLGRWWQRTRTRQRRVSIDGT